MATDKMRCIELSGSWMMVVVIVMAGGWIGHSGLTQGFIPEKPYRRHAKARVFLPNNTL